MDLPTLDIDYNLCLFSLIFSREKEIYNKHMTSVCVRLFLEFWEKHVIAFIADFQKLTVSDEKVKLSSILNLRIS